MPLPSCMHLAPPHSLENTEISCTHGEPPHTPTPSALITNPLLQGTVLDSYNGNRMAKEGVGCFVSPHATALMRAMCSL